MREKERERAMGERESLADEIVAAQPVPILDDELERARGSDGHSLAL